MINIDEVGDNPYSSDGFLDACGTVPVEKIVIDAYSVVAIVEIIYSLLLVS